MPSNKVPKKVTPVKLGPILFAALSLAASSCTVAAHEGHTSTGRESVARLIHKGDAAMQRSRDRLEPSLYATAEAAYRRALKTDSRSAAAMVGLAWVHNSEHEFAEGRRWAEAALAIDPKNPEALALIGDGAVELGEYDAAFEFYQKAIDVRPDLSSYSRAAQLLWLTGDTKGARSLMERAIAAGGPAAENTAWCRAQLALMHFNGGELDAADRLLADGLRLAPGNAHLLLAAGRVRAARGEAAAAVEALERSIAGGASHAALATLAELYSAAGREPEARAQFERVVAFHRGHSGDHAHDDAGHDHAPGHASAELALFLADNDRDILTAFASARSAHDAFPNVFSADALAWCAFKAGQLEQAESSIREALRLGTPVADFHFHAGMIYARMGDSAAARTHFERALALNPAFHPRHARVAREQLALLGPGKSG